MNVPDRGSACARVLAGLLLAFLAISRAGTWESVVYDPALAVPDIVAPFLKYLDPGNDAFPAERDAIELEAQLRAWGDALRAAPGRAAELTRPLLATDFRGARLLPDDEGRAAAKIHLEVTRAHDLPRELSLDARAFAAELQRFVDGLGGIRVAEFHVVSIDTSTPLVRTDVRYDVAGSGEDIWRAERVGTWRMSWRRTGEAWRVVEWAAASNVTSRAARPVFTEITSQALGSNDAFVRQLNIDLDAWMATLDSVLTRDTNGHHGVSVGDVDGDGLEDLYVAQPAGLPNRLFRALGDSTFVDVTERAGVGVLDDTAQSLFADIDNDADQDLVLSTGTKPLLFSNDGNGRFTHVPDAFRFERPLQGLLTSMSMADYDRDGFLDLYLCVYSYFYGAGEEKAGTPAPYHDARNGPPGVLFRNDGRGRFVDATRDAGLDEGNDRYHFAAAWADYDGDGWTDLLVANDFGTKNLYRSRGRRDGRVTFEDVAAKAGVLDHGAGMSAAFFDYDNDGLLDIYTGNMWSASGRRVTASPAFMPDAPPEVRALYRRHARGNALLRNRGDGTFEDTTLGARAEMGRWAWSSDALDFDNDGWQDIYIVNGMLSRDAPVDRAGDSVGPPRARTREQQALGSAAPGAVRETDLEGFFWRQVVARSPLTRAKGTPYDDAWRAINQLLIHQSIASRQRNVFLRNDGKGKFDEISGAVGLDLDQDGRSFAVLDLDRDGDSDLAVMAARQAPHLRVFRNDLATASSLAVRLVGTKSNRDAIGARVIVETADGRGGRQIKVVQAGSGFLSQHSKELVFGLGASAAVRALTVEWPSGARQTFADVPAGGRVRVIEGGALEREPFAAKTDPSAARIERAPMAAGRPPEGTWFYEPVPTLDFSLADVRGTTQALSTLRRPAVLLFWSTDAPASQAAYDALARGHRALVEAGIGAIAIALDRPADAAKVRAAAAGTLPLVHATEQLGLTFAILHRHLFMNRQPLRLPTTLLLDAQGRVVKVYRDAVDVAAIRRDATAIETSATERLARALPFPGAFHSPVAPRNYLPYGRELQDQGLDRAAVVAFERAAQANPSASTLYRLGTLLAKSGEVGRARSAFERALAIQPDLAEASNDLGALLAQEGDVARAIELFRAAIAATPEYPDALNNLGYAMLLTGREAEARAFYERALALQPDFPEALNNLGMLLGRAGDLDRAEGYFRDALARRGDYGEAANNLALVLVARGQTDAAVQLLDEFLRTAPHYEPAYVTLAKIHLSAGRSREGLRALEALLQRNPTHAVARELLREWKGR
jgi:Flp pilus assembly protein TadD/peroxiredoxin